MTTAMTVSTEVGFSLPLGASHPVMWVLMMRFLKRPEIGTAEHLCDAQGGHQPVDCQESLLDRRAPSKLDAQNALLLSFS